MPKATLPFNCDNQNNPSNVPCVGEQDFPQLRTVLPLLGPRRMKHSDHRDTVGLLVVLVPGQGVRQGA